MSFAVWDDSAAHVSMKLDSGGAWQVITGPNMSGKSCYAKQVALIVFLAHIGSFVPAQAATVGLTDRILTRVARQDSQSSLQSTFLADLTQVAAMLQQTTSRQASKPDFFCGLQTGLQHAQADQSAAVTQL